jgi:hypothetical protein
VLETEVPDTLPKTVIWVDDVYLAHKIADDGTPVYKLTTNYVVKDTHPSGVYKRPNFDD